MTFNSLPYAVFLPLVLAGYWLIPGRGAHQGLRRHARQLWLLAASYLFYAFFDVRWALLLLFTTAVDYQVAKGIENLDAPRGASVDGCSCTTRCAQVRQAINPINSIVVTNTIGLPASELRD